MKHLGIVYNNGTESGGIFSVTLSVQENMPATMVSWYGANEYCRWLSEKRNIKFGYQVSLNGSTQQEVDKNH